jgi:putative flippase GtrA
MALEVQSRWQSAWTLVRRHETKVRFLLAGALNTVVGLAAYPVLFFLLARLKLHYMVVLGITQVTCVAFSYLTNKFLVFRTVGNYLRESGKFVLFHLSYFLVNLPLPLSSQAIFGTATSRLPHRAPNDPE